MTSNNSPINSQTLIDRINDPKDVIEELFCQYAEGWNDRGEDDIKKNNERVKANIHLTFIYIEEILDELKNIDTVANSIYFKINSLQRQTVLFTIPIDKYLSDKFLQMHTLSAKIEKRSKSEDYSVSISYTFDEGDIDEESLFGDGFLNIFPSKNCNG